MAATNKRLTGCAGLVLALAMLDLAASGSHGQTTRVRCYANSLDEYDRTHEGFGRRDRSVALWGCG
jgi:hypothetical protein